MVFSIDPCGTAALPKLTLTRIGSDPVAGDDGLKLKAETKLRQGTFASFDPITSGAHLVVTAADGTPRLDVAIPAGALGGSGTAGWKLNGAGTAWSFTDATASPAGGIKKVKIVDRGSVLPNMVRVIVTGKNGSYPVVAGDEPLQARLELGSSALCSASRFVGGECGFSGVGSKLVCKGR